MKIGDYYNLTMIDWRKKESQKTIISKKEENGYDDQYFKQEEINWVVLDIDEEKGTALLISDKPTEQEITLERTSTATKTEYIY